MSRPPIRFERSALNWMLCLNCATVFEAVQSKAYECPDCDYRFDSTTLLNRTKLAADAVRFGYQYRKVYEEGLEEEGPKRHYSLLLLHEIVEWVVLAAISGLIGGASTELAKRAVTKIKEQVATEPRLKDLDEARLVLDDEEFKKLMLYIIDFLTGMENVPREVKAAIIEEMITERAVELARRKKEADELRSPAADAIEELKKEDLLDQADFENMWKDIDC